MASAELYPPFQGELWPAGTTLLPPHPSADPTSVNLSSPANATDSGGLGAIYSATQTALIVIVAGVLISITVVGNIMVMVSFHIDKQLQTISNYFLFSLAVADFAIGLISMPLFTVYQVMGRWVMGPIVCDTWLSLDYLASNASVLNLLIISFDRYFSVTRPLTYRARRTNQRAAAMIACAWGISLVLWPPWIYAWPYIEGKRTVEPDECYIQFLQTNHYWTFGTAIAAFYLPVLIMCGLYYRIWLETEQRQRDLTHLQAGKNNSRRSNSSSEPGDSHSVTPEATRRGRLEHASSGEGEDSLSSDTKLTTLFKQMELTRWQRLAAWCRGESTRHRRAFSGFCTPTTTDTPLPGVPRWLALAGGARLLTPKPHPKLRHTRSDTAAGIAYLSRYGRHEVPSPLPALRSLRRNRSTGALGRASPSPSSDSVYTIVIKLPEAPTASGTSGSITMRCEPESPALSRVMGVSGVSGVTDISGVTEVSGVTDVSDAHQPHCPLSRAASRRTRVQDDDELSSDGGLPLPLPPPPPVSRRPSQLPDFRIPLNARVIPKQLVRIHNPKKKKKREEKKQDRKAAKTLSAILLAFIITWTPYNVLVLIRVMLECDDCIPDELWNFSYYLCYINSTVNPLCYALCNASFRRTYVKILTCTWHKNKHQAAGRLHYN